MKLLNLLASLILIVPLGCAPRQLVAHKPVGEPRYPYGSDEFLSFVKDSYHIVGEGSAKEFTDWFDTAFRSASGAPVHEWLTKTRALLNAKQSSAEVQLEVATEIHRIIKRAIPKFSLDRGFEFYNVARLGERQCLLQSVLTASLLQASGMKCGIVMVWQNQKGDKSNNGHVVCLLHLPADKSVLVDCSDPTPFVSHQGLFMRRKLTGTYMFVTPAYDEFGQIVSGVSLDDNSTIDSDGLVCLGYDYVKSQFDFYRGERVPGGLLSETGTPAALRESARYLAKSLNECRMNSLALYSLGKVHVKLGNLDIARRELSDAVKLYRAQGWVPPGPADALAANHS